MANNENSNLENIMKKRIDAMYTVFSYIEQMKNLFPIDRYYIEKTKLVNEKILIARSKNLYYIKEDESIENKDICDALEKLKNAMLCYFDEYHIENLENDIKSYNIPQKDIDILIEIVNGYKNEYYFLVITTLLTRIEGLFFKFFNYKGDTRGKIKGLVTETIKKNKNKDKYISSSKKAYDSVIDIYKNKLSKNFKYGDPNIMSDLKDTLLFMVIQMNMEQK
ncbi:hypothetical protein [Staphylococcus capitis]|uniref:hypothetical protein n=2 Tax=Staphylococcus capitis TaxID=29388 RepID=UPI000D1AA769|nr:hypothetical protein [Staphylococcus capitis]PTG31254.1 hypothetical protein BU630_01365 [Staphylococcus capitis]PTG98938.1 hypothetical protein BU625_04525 [Staphylococcus capitis]PTH06182.1 hypothetical protein BU621_01285 [Staphylococcus capitis]PTH13049.1 hypothetical protein BU622_10900 [Staphylococcus capitis]PTH19997.1 hypothetical protein BU612_08640 [Staphylococcus capitis]